VKAPAPWVWIVTTAVVGVGAAWLLFRPSGQASAVGVAAVPTVVAVVVGVWRVEVEVEKERGKEQDE